MAGTSLRGACELTVHYRRVYAEPVAGEGYRVLVDRLWPRGVSKERADWDEWMRDIAPSTELREWYGHQPDRFPEFRRRYEAELESPERQRDLDELREHAAAGPLTLLTATRDADISEAAVLTALLNETPQTPRRSTA